jgi:very-short-patch-repair endonuclease
MTFDELLARQSGRFTRGQARTGGFSAYRIGRRIESGEWRVVHGRVLALAAVPDSLPSREWVALLSAGPGATFAGPSAARRHSFEISDARPCVLVPPDRRPDVPDGVVVLRRELPIVDIVAREDCLLTGRDCTVIDCALLLDEPAAMRFVERALQKSWISSYKELTVRTQEAVGRRRAKQLVAIVRALGSGAHSDTERRLVTGLRSHGMIGWSCNHEVTDQTGVIGIIDVAFPAIKLAIELDGRAWHVDRDRFQHDRTRQNRLVAAGWTVLRFTWDDVAYRLDTVLADISAAVARLTSR